MSVARARARMSRLGLGWAGLLVGVENTFPPHTRPWVLVWVVGCVGVVEIETYDPLVRTCARRHGRPEGPPCLSPSTHETRPTGRHYRRLRRCESKTARTAALELNIKKYLYCRRSTHAQTNWARRGINTEDRHNLTRTKSGLADPAI